MTEVTSVNGHTGAVVLTAVDVEAVPTSAEGKPGGVATLDGSGALPEAQLPSSVVSGSPGEWSVGAALVYTGIPGSLWMPDTSRQVAPRPSGGDDTAAIIAALPACGCLTLQSGKYKLAGRITLKKGQDLRQPADDPEHLTSPNQIECTTEAAGITSEESGTVTGPLNINAAGIATEPWVEKVGSERTFQSINVTKSAQDNFRLLGIQNATHIACRSIQAARDNLVLDKGAGGNVFINFESSEPGRYGVHANNEIAGGPYEVPTQNTFFGGRSERGGKTTTSMVRIKAGECNSFRDFVVEGKELLGPLIDLETTGTTLFDGGFVQGLETADTGVKITQGILVVQGDWRLELLKAAWLLEGANTRVLVNGRVHELHCTERYTGTGTATTIVRSRLEQVLQLIVPAPEAIIMSQIGDAGGRFKLFSSGEIGWEPGGAAFTFPNRLIPAAGQMGFNVNLAVTVAGQGLRVKEGTNAKQGLSGAMVAGKVTVANTSITATSRLHLTRQAGGTHPGAVYESERVAGEKFVITSTNPEDTGTVAYQIFEPA